MKSIKLLQVFTVLTILSTFTFGIKLKIINDLQVNWNKMFEDPTRSMLMCKEKPKVEQTKEEVAMDKEKALADVGSLNIPKKKQNYYAKMMQGWGPSAYLFDFLDDVLEKEVTQAFSTIWDAAKLITPDPNYIDPYTLESMTGMKESDADMIKRIHTLMTNGDEKSTFDEKAWKESLTCGKIDALLREWKWFINRSVPDPAKYIVDKFDFNGDGRLSPKEFIMAMIRTNKLIAQNGQCKNCMEDVIQNFIDPIFMYLDCQNEERINAENLWTNIGHMNRKAKNSFNFLLCDYNGGGWRTSTTNDFIIKAQKTMDGYVNKSEFRLAVLQGYWSRHVDDYSISKDCSMSMKKFRWNCDGTTDLICDSLKSGHPPPKTQDICPEKVEPSTIKQTAEAAVAK